MKLPIPARLLLAACALLALPSCEVVPGQYGGTPYGSGYDSGYLGVGGDYSGYEGSDSYSGYSSRPFFSGSVGSYYSTGYARPYYPSSYSYGGGGPRYYRGGFDHYDHDHNHSSNRDYDRGDRGRGYSSSNNNNRSSGDAIRLVKVRDGSYGNLPEGYHSKEYFKNRGISLSKNVYETRDGERRGYTGGPKKKK
jgi:hypothetical protein